MNNTIILKTEITWTGNTSLKIKINTFVKHLNLNKKHINKTYLIFITINKNNKPQPIKPYKPITTLKHKKYNNTFLKKTFQLKLHKKTKTLQKLANKLKKLPSQNNHILQQSTNKTLQN